MSAKPGQMYDFDIILQTCHNQVSQLICPEAMAAHNLTPVGLCHKIANIVRQNLESGRALRATCKQAEQPYSDHSPLDADTFPGKDDGPADEFLNEYVGRVLKTYLSEHPRLELLEQGDAAAWQILLDELIAKATYLITTRWQIPVNITNQEVVELVQETCIIIYHKFFPCDVPFTAWATKILQNCILQRYTRSRDLIDRRPAAITSLDRPTTAGTEETSWLHETLTDDTDIGNFERLEKQEILLQAIAQLRSNAQSEVIILTYFKHLNDNEIANTLGKTRNAVQILRHRALQQLRIILDKSERTP